jgi:hypothetical protein
MATKLMTGGIGFGTFRFGRLFTIEKQSANSPLHSSIRVDYNF